jgi:hypothetical protein
MRSEVKALKQEPQFAAFVSIDWADKKHVWCLQAAGSEKRESGELVHTPEAVEAWVGQLCQRFANRPIAVALEQSRGALVFMLSKYEPLHLFPVPSTKSAVCVKRCIHRAARMIPAMLAELAHCARVIGQLVVWGNTSRQNVRTHDWTPPSSLRGPE